MNTIICKHCGKEFELSEALLHQVKETAKQEFDSEHKKDLEKVRLDAFEKAKKEAEDKQALEFADLKQELLEQKKKNDEFREEQLKLREDKRKLEEEKKDFELELQRKVEDKVKESLEREDERHRLKELENEKKLQDAIKANEELRRKLEQGSQQTQGEVLELDFENTLISEFSDDEIIPIAKGKTGGDIRQIVKTPKGTVCGVILWETKRVKAWANDWTEKLKNDLRAEKANIPIIVTNVFPRGFNGNMGIFEGVWLVGYSHAVVLAQLMRQRLIDVAREKYFAQNSEKNSSKDLLYEYVVGHEFVQVVESHLEAYNQLIKQVSSEKVAYEKQWKERLEIADKIMRSTARMVGSVQGKLGNSATLQIKGLDILSLDSGEE